MIRKLERHKGLCTFYDSPEDWFLIFFTCGPAIKLVTSESEITFCMLCVCKFNLKISNPPVSVKEF